MRKTSCRHYDKEHHGYCLQQGAVCNGCTPSSRKLPEFDAYEINELSQRARMSSYYAQCLKFVKDTLLNDLYDASLLTEKQVKWLWGIKKDLKESM